MGFLKKLDTHSGLIGSMAETIHADLTDALQSGRLSGQELRNTVMTCIGCEGACDCQQWMDEHKAGAEDTPVYCRNREMLNRIKTA